MVQYDFETSGKISIFLVREFDCEDFAIFMTRIVTTDR